MPKRKELTQTLISDDVHGELAEPGVWYKESWVEHHGLNLAFEKAKDDRKGPRWRVTGSAENVEIMRAAAAAWEKHDRLIAGLYAANYAEHDRIDAMRSEPAVNKATAELRRAKGRRAIKTKAPAKRRAA